MLASDKNLSRDNSMTDQLLKSIHNKSLLNIAEKVIQGIPVSEGDAMFMLTSNDILELGAIAHHMRTQLHGDRVFYGVNMNLNYTNICELRCPLCAFSRDEEDEDAYLLSLDEIETRVKEAVCLGIDEVHIVGGLHPHLRIEYFEEMLRRIKGIDSNLFIVAFTAVEYDYLARINKLPLKEVFTRLIDAGLGALPGGGAEIFAPEIRRIIAPKKISGKRWLEVMRTAHSLGLKTNVTMLYNHCEDVQDIVDHLSQIRLVQEERSGFKTFVPLPYHDSHTQIQARRRETTGLEDIRLFATSRIFLHNIPHLKALWMYLGDKMAQVLLRFGVDEMGATYHNERIVHAAGATTPDYGSEAHLRRLIENSGLQPLRTTANYEPAGGT
ncbi:MAG: CofH family radical SAM protein [Thermodesulfobacteriota bacterium]|nr:CofH family radical SAM protein [Thermodesulfobacteriota bacterium]